ncbi:MAG: glycine oxidase ThiO [Thermoleophilaceae bacterium]
MSPTGPHRSSCDLIVVGAGAVGLASAWRAVRAGMSVTVVERDRAGAGASGVAAGMLAPVTEADFGEEELLAMNLEGRALWGDFASLLEDRSGLASGYVDSGCLVVAIDRDDGEELRRLHSFQQGLGLRSEWLAPRAARTLEPGLSPRIAGAIITPEDGQVDPAAVVAALARAFSNDGGELREGVEVTELVEHGGRVTGVRTAEGIELRAPAVLVAAGAWSAAGGLGELPAAPPVRPVKGQLLELRVRAGHGLPAERVVRTPRCYVVPRADGRVVVGATTEEQGFDLTVTADGVFRLLEAAIEVLPDVAELELVHARAGLRPGTPEGRPVIAAAGPEGLLWATGHGRNGVLLAPLTAERVLGLLGAPAPSGARV